MSRQYDNYLREHGHNVYRGYLWLISNLDEKELDDILPDIKYPEMMMQMKCHDDSKNYSDEYDAYDRYFYGPGRGNPEVRKEFNLAWLKHIHRNPHHWQHWVLVHDDGADGDKRKVEALDMPDNYILEMICDWWAFSWKEYNEEVNDAEKANKALYEIFDWYDEHEDGIMLSPATKKKVDDILDLINDKLGEFEDAEEIDEEDEDLRDIDDPDGGTVVIVGGNNGD